MKERKTYYITKTEDGWQGKVEGGKKASTTGSTKAEVVGKTIEIDKNNSGNSNVIIHKRDGKIQEERTFPRSSDPNETPG